MSEPESLLPSPTPRELALSLASASRRPVDADLIRRSFDPYGCPSHLLPYLAHAFGVRLWVESWPETRKRSMVANAILLRRLEGTRDGLERMLAYVDVTVRKVTTPPAKVYSGPSLTRADREAWLARLPQLRVWRVLERGTAGLRLFSGGAARPGFLEGRYVQPNGAPGRLARRARWVVGGTETDTRVVSTGSTFQLFIRALAGSAVFADRPIGGRFFQPSTAAQRIVTIAPVSTSPWRGAVGPSLAPVTSEPELVAQPGTERRRVVSGRPIGGRHFQPSTADYRLFERYAVDDGSFAAKRPSIQIMGTGRYGLPAHTAEVALRIRGRRRGLAAGEGIAAPRTRYWLPHDAEPMRLVRAAGQAAMRRSDVVLLETKTPSGFVAGQILIAGGVFRA